MLVRPLSSALQQKAENELNEVPSRIQDDLQHIKDWLAKQPHLKARTDDQWLLSFLRGSKFSLQQTKEKLDMNYTMRSLLPEYFSKRDPFQPEIQELLKRSVILWLPKTTDLTGPRIIIIRPGASDPEKVCVVTAAKVMLMILDILIIEDDQFVIGGQEILGDLHNLSYKYMGQVTPSILRKVSWCLQYAYSTRPKGFHVINCPSFFQSLYNLIKTLFKKKVIDRVTFYTEDNHDALHKTIPLSILPKEYGGEGDSIDKLAAEMKLKVESYRDWFLQDENYYSDESKRPGNSKTAESMFGTEGSFRKLHID